MNTISQITISKTTDFSFRSVLSTLMLSLFILLFLVMGAGAAPPTDLENYCQRVLSRLDHQSSYQSLRESADDNHCRKAWVRGQAKELMACGDPYVSGTVTSDLKKAVNSGVGQSKSAKYPAFFGLDARPMRGAIGERQQLFMGVALAHNTQELNLEIPGRYQSEAHMTVCQIDMAGNIGAIEQVGWPLYQRGTRNLVAPAPTSDWDFKVNLDENRETRLIVAILDFVTSREHEFSISMSNEWTNLDEPVYGISDLHVHQMAELAFGGRLLWGSHAGDIPTSLNPDTLSGNITNPEDLKATPNGAFRISQTMKDEGIDGNVAMAAMKNKVDDEGEVVLEIGGYPGFQNWPHHAERSHQQVHVSWLEQAVNSRRDTHQNLSLMVNSLVNNDILCWAFTLIDRKGNVPTTGDVGSESEDYGCSDYETVVRQITAAYALENEHSWYRIALSPWHAREIVQEGDLAVVLSIETDKPLSDANGDYGTPWIDTLDDFRDRGVRSLQVAHESDSIFCGAALHRGEMNALQLIHWPEKGLTNQIQNSLPFRIDRGDLSNYLGATDEGLNLFAAMVDRNMPIDISHASTRCQEDIIMNVPENYGLYSSHTKFERLLRRRAADPDHGAQVIAREKNFLIREDAEDLYIDNDILIGLRTASIDIYDAPVDTSYGGQKTIKNNCPGSSKSFAQMVKYAYDRGFNFTFGTDFNTGVSQLGPRMGEDNTRCYAALPKLDVEYRSTRPVGAVGDDTLTAQANTRIDDANTNYYNDGLAHIGWLPELAWDLQNELEAIDETGNDNGRGVDGALQLNSGTRKFIAMWEKAYNPGAPRPRFERNVGSVSAGDLAIGEFCDRNRDCASNKCQGRMDGKRSDRICVCSNDTQCGLIKTGSVCAKPFLQQNFCVVEDIRQVGETCYTDKACASGKCNARDGRKGICECRADSDCRGTYQCKKRGPRSNICEP